MSYCMGDAPTVPESELFGSGAFTGPGSTSMSATMASPRNGDSNIPLDANIILVFPYPVDDAGSNITSSISITGSLPASHPIGYTVTGTGTTVTLDPSVDFVSGETVTVAINAALHDTSLAWTLPGNYTLTFTATTAPAANATYPRVLAGTQYPLSGATGVGVKQSYIDFTFNKAMAAGTMTTANVTVLRGAGFQPVKASLVNTGGNTWRLNLNANPVRYLEYGEAYTVTLSAAMTDGTNPLVLDGQSSWSFNTETDPGAPPTPGVDSAWAENKTLTAADVLFITDQSVNAGRCYVRYGTTTGTYTVTTIAEGDWDGDAKLNHILHKVHLPSAGNLTASTTYYYQIWLDLNNSATVDAGETSGEYSFMTRKVVSVAGGNQYGTVVLQNPSGGGYVFWLSDQASTGDIYGQHYNTAGLPQWNAPGGILIANSGNSLADIAVVADSTGNDAIIVFRDTVTEQLYAKRVNNAGGDVWGAGAGGANLGITVLASSKFSAAYRNTNFLVGYIETVNGQVKVRRYSEAACAPARFFSSVKTVTKTGDDTGLSSGGYTGTGNGTFTIWVSTAGTINAGGTGSGRLSYDFDGGAPQLLNFIPKSGVSFPLDVSGVNFTITDGGNGTINFNDKWQVEVGDRIVVYNAALFTKVDLAPNTSGTSDFFAVYSTGTQIDASNVDINLTTVPMHKKVWTQTNIFNNIKSNFGWLNTEVVKVLQSTVWPADTCYLLAHNTTTKKVGLAMLREGTDIQWAYEFDGRDPDMVIDTTAALDERSLIAYRFYNASNFYEIRAAAIDSGGNMLGGWPKAISVAGALYDCTLPRITLGNSDGTASSFNVAWIDPRSGKYRVYGQQLTSAGAANWTSIIFETAAAVSGLWLLYWDASNPAYWGMLPVWIENAVDLYYELVDDTGTY